MRLTKLQRGLWGCALAVALAAGALLAPVWLERRRAAERVWRVGVDHAPPYNILEDGRHPSGLAVEMLQEAARRSGVRLQFVPTDLPVDEAFRRGLVDIWPAATDTPERRRWLHATEPWLTNRLCVVSRSSRPVLSASDLSHKRIALLRKRILNDIVGPDLPPGIELLEMRSRDAGLLALCQGRVDAAVMEQRFLERTLLDRPPACSDVPLQVLNAAGADRHLTILAVQPAAAAADRLRQGISDLVEEGAFATVLDHWSAFSGGEVRLVTSLEDAHRQLRNEVLALVFLSAAGLLLVIQNRRLRRATRKAGEASRAKSEFLASVSHEIRTPLNGILGMTELILADETDPERKDHLEIIRDSGRSLLVLINDLLDSSRIEAGQLKMERIPFAPAAVARQVCALVEPQAEAKGLELSLHLGALATRPLLGDSHRLEQVLLNLVGNAVKFTEQGRIDVTVNVRPETQAARLEIQVRDTGIGVEPEKLPHLFERFYQADSSSTRRYGGTGLGLAISRQLVDLMGGSIAVDSRPGQGSEFTVTLPLEPAQPGWPQAVPEPEIASACPCRVLLVEDNPVNELVARRMLERLGCQVRSAGNGREACSILGDGGAAEPFDLVLMDCLMPEMDGYEATRTIRRLPSASRAVPIVALTASPLEDDLRRCQAVGMNDYLSKPVGLDDMERVVRKWTRRNPA